MNWGVKIFITLLIFMVVAITTGIYMVSQDHDSLVEDNYYDKGISFDSTYNHKSNVEQLHAAPQIIVEGEYLAITFQQKGNKGTIHFQRTSDSSLDKEIPFSIASEFFQTPITDLSSGKWKIIITWKHNDTPFLFEKTIFIP